MKKTSNSPDGYIEKQSKHLMDKNSDVAEKIGGHLNLVTAHPVNIDYAHARDHAK